MKKEVEEEHIAAHKNSIYHETEVMESEKCGCFSCGETFPPSAIREWTDEGSADNERTALCPRCGVDSVIGSKSGFPIEKSFLRKMRNYWL
jgi:hypothetical protein